MSTKLYYSRSTASLVVHWLLIELGIPHELHELDFDKRDQKSDEYLKLNPAGVVPTLVMDGQVITETAAILMHLADTHPRAELAPAVATTQRAQYYRWMLFCANTLMPAYRAWFYPDEIAVKPISRLRRITPAPSWKRPGDRSPTIWKRTARTCSGRNALLPISC